MRFKVDENLHDDVAVQLAGAGHDAETVHTEGLRGCIDSVLAHHCVSEGRAIVTLDLDFADIRAFPPALSAGIIVIRVRDQSRSRLIQVMTRVIDLLKRETVIGRLWIVTDAGVRIRGA
jgi:predicted nuclease of predicted toxin-antitoxin system